MGEGVRGEVMAGLGVSRPVLVARLLELDAVGVLSSAHVRAGAQVGGVSVRTVWRWLEAARTEGRVERRSRMRLELSDKAWEVLAQAGGNVAALHRYLVEGGGEVPSLASLQRVVRRDLQAGRVLPDRVVVRREREEQRTRQALADLALAGTRVGAAAGAAAGRSLSRVPAQAADASAGEGGVAADVALPLGAQLVRTSSVRAVAEAVGQAMAVQGAVCVFGDPGRGKTAAVRMALHEVPVGWRVTWVPVRPSVAGMRRAVFDALGLPGRFPHTSVLADAAVAEALGDARVRRDRVQLTGDEVRAGGRKVVRVLGLPRGGDDPRDRRYPPTQRVPRELVGGPIVRPCSWSTSPGRLSWYAWKNSSGLQR